MISLSSIVYFVSDVESTRLWIEDVLEIEPYRLENSFVGYKLENQELCIHEIDEKCGTEIGNQICYWEVKDMDLMIERLQQKGCELYRSPLKLKEGGRVCQMKSPFNFVIGLKESV